MMKRTWVMSVMILWATSVWAETVYVSDKVYVDIRADAHYESPVAYRLLAGTQLEVLEQSGDFTRVRDAQGRVGWIENRELTRDLPATLRQAEVERELATMRAKLAKTQRDLQQAQKLLAEDTADEKAIVAAQADLKRQLAGTRERLAETRATLTRAQAAVAKSQQELNRTKAALAEQTARNEELASQLAAKVAPASPPAAMKPPPPLAPATNVEVAPMGAEQIVVGSGDGPLPPLAPEPPTTWQRMVAQVAGLDFLWLGISFAMLVVGLALGAVWWRERYRRKLGGMYLRV
jgi:SH3 domain protein